MAKVPDTTDTVVGHRGVVGVTATIGTEACDSEFSLASFTAAETPDDTLARKILAKKA